MMEKTVMNVKGMTCNHCVQTVKGALGALPGVKQVDVLLDKGEVTVAYDESKARPDQFKEAVVEAGYEVA
jgi:copper chaperone